MIYEIHEPEVTAPLFADWNETLIWSCLQKVMGKIYADSTEAPVSAMAILGDFCFFSGIPNKELISYKPVSCKQDFMIMIPQNEHLAKMIEQCYGAKAKKVTRYAIKKEKGVFNKQKLKQAAASVPEGYTLQMIDSALFSYCRETPWCRDFVSQYPDYATYQKYGMGVVILKDREPVSGASSYSGYLSGIEIEVDTKEEYRRQGLAYICCAKLILKCLEKGWYPSWDAQNKWSVALAEKLGYHFDREYTAYEIWGY